jgi:hypothetical protein
VAAKEENFIDRNSTIRLHSLLVLTMYAVDDFDYPPDLREQFKTDSRL